MNIEFMARYYPITCREFPEKLFVFGDNMEAKGTAGQACIRREPNSFGVVTKRSPRVDVDAYFKDREDEQECLLKDLRLLYGIGKSGRILVFPANGLGTGLALMRTKSPALFKLMNDILNQYFFRREVYGSF